MKRNNTKLFELIDQLKNNILKRVKLSEFKLDLVLSAFFISGHIILEDLPGLGKTTLAKTLAESCNIDKDINFSRIQFTADLLPYDIIGTEFFDKDSSSFKFRKGPIFTTILLADELNRGNPKVQSALLEAMGEKQVSIGGKTYKLDELFFVIATQNPYEIEGTFPLPISSLDRFMISLSLDYPSQNDEFFILKNNLLDFFPEKINHIISRDDILEIKNSIINNVFISEELIYVILKIGHLSRERNYFKYGFSTRALLHLLNFVKSFAFVSGKRDFVIDDDIKKCSYYVFSHRISENKDKLDIIVDEALIDRIK